MQSFLEFLILISLIFIFEKSASNASPKVLIISIEFKLPLLLTKLSESSHAAFSTEIFKFLNLISKKFKHPVKPFESLGKIFSLELFIEKS